MKKYNLLGFVIAVIFITSCRFERCDWSKYPVKQPYLVGDSIVFVSKSGDIETLKITRIEIDTIIQDTHALLPMVIHQMHVFARIWDDQNDNIYSILSMKEFYDKNIVCLDLNLGNDICKYPATALEGTQNDSVTRIGGDLDLLLIPAKNYFMGLDTEGETLKYILWSDKYGYLKFYFIDGDYWEVRKFIRNGNTMNFVITSI